MANQACQKIHHGTRHAGYLDKQPEKDKQRHRQQNDVAHPLVHARDDDGQGRARRQRQECECANAEREYNRHAGQHRATDEEHEEDDQLVIAHRHEQWLGKPQGEPDRSHKRKSQCHIAQGMPHAHPQEPEHKHQPEPDGERRRPPDILDFQRRRNDQQFIVRVFDGWIKNQSQKRDASGQRQGLQDSPHPWLRARNQRRHAHVFGALVGEYGPEHRQP